MLKKNKEIYCFGPYRVDVGERIFERTDGVINGALPEKAFQTLVVLLRNRGRLVLKGEIIESVWPDAIVEENNLDKSIHAIRTALHDTPSEKKYIETVRKHGYRFVADVDRSECQDTTAEREGDRPQHGDRSSFAELGDNLRRPLDSRAAQHRGALERLWPYLVLSGVLIVLATIALAVIMVQRAGTSIDTAAALSEEPRSAGVAGLSRSQANDLYVRGKVKVRNENREDTEAAITLLEQAVSVDPNFAEAHAALARGYNTMAFKYSSDLESKHFHENAEVAIEKALTLDPDLAEGHFARGLILWSNTKGFPHEQAIRSYKRSLELNPALDETHHQLSLVYSHIGLLDEAHQSIKSALEINPNNTLARFREGVYVAYQGKFAEAIAKFKTIPRDVTPLLVDRSMAEALIQIGHTAEAEKLVDEHLRRFPRDEGGSFMSVKALLLAKAGKNQEAETVIHRAVEIGDGFGHFHHTAYNIASGYAAMGRPDEAVKWLRTTAESGFPNYLYFKNDPNLSNIREHPSFIGFMNNLRAQWHRYRTAS